MIDLIYDDIATRLYHEWMQTTHPDTPVISYYGSCNMADTLTETLIKPFRKDFIETVMAFNMHDSEAQQIQHLYITYTALNNPDCMEAMVIELYLFLIEQYRMPFHAVVRVIDGIGNMVYTAEEADYD